MKGNWLLRKISGTARQEVTRAMRKLHNEPHNLYCSHSIFWGNCIKMDEIGRTYGKHGRNKTFWLENLIERNQCVDLDRLNDSYLFQLQTSYSVAYFKVLFLQYPRETEENLS
jgi:hypothetical protein